MNGLLLFAGLLCAGIILYLLLRSPSSTWWSSIGDKANPLLPQIRLYLDSIYPDSDVISSLSDCEAYNFFLNLGMYYTGNTGLDMDIGRAKSGSASLVMCPDNKSVCPSAAKNLLQQVLVIAGQSLGDLLICPQGGDVGQGGPSAKSTLSYLQQSINANLDFYTTTDCTYSWENTDCLTYSRTVGGGGRCRLGSVANQEALPGDFYAIGYSKLYYQIFHNSLFSVKDPKDNAWINSRTFDPSYLFLHKQLSSRPGIEASLVNGYKFTDGFDGSGKDRSYIECTCLDYNFQGIKDRNIPIVSGPQKISPNYFTSGPGVPSGQYLEISRNQSDDSSSPQVWLYAATGVGNNLNCGSSLRALNKIHACILLFKLAYTQLSMVNTKLYMDQTDNPTFTTPMNNIMTKDGMFPRTWLDYPQLPLMEFLLRYPLTFTMTNISKGANFGYKPNTLGAELWPIQGTTPGSLTNIYPGGFTGDLQSIMGFMPWWYAHFGVDEPNWQGVTDKLNAGDISAWSLVTIQQIKLLGTFFTCTWMPYFSSADWEYNYIWNRFNVSAGWDRIIYGFVNPRVYPSAKNTLTGVYLNTYASTPFKVQVLDEVKANTWYINSSQENGSFIVAEGKPYILTISGEPIETVQCVMQPNPNYHTQHEVCDFRTSNSLWSHLGDCPTSPNACFLQQQLFNMYSTKYLRVGTASIDHYRGKDSKACIPQYPYPGYKGADGKEIPSLGWSFLTCKGDTLSCPTHEQVEKAGDMAICGGYNENDCDKAQCCFVGGKCVYKVDYSRV